jgi:anhydro-N-acetylmuramic acid kinase
MSAELYIGLISGTSADGIDCALVDFSAPPLKLLRTHSHPIPNELRNEILELMVPTNNEIDRLGVADQLLGEEFAKAVEQLLAEANIDAAQIKAIGSHGQTLRHRPPGELTRAYTLQIGDPNIIAERTGITTVGDMRRRDMAAGGQGAPLAPIIHQQLFKSFASDRVIVNIGGIANITHLQMDGTVLGFDTGPGNCLMDAWISRHQQKNYDHNGEWAAKGQAQNDLLQSLLMHPYFSTPSPKSTGREMFTMAWLDSILKVLREYKAEDVQATLLHLSANTIANHIRDLNLPKDSDIYICGGGAHNSVLMEELGRQLHPYPVASTELVGLSPDWVEACAFAFMAKQTLDRQPGNLPSVTGANRPVILGGVYFN